MTTQTHVLNLLLFNQMVRTGITMPTQVGFWDLLQEAKYCFVM
jgi:hypothetical protein